MFEPIAVVGRGCVLPGALNPEEFWGSIMAKRAGFGAVPDGYWRMEPGQHPGEPGTRPATAVGGYVRDFPLVWDPAGFCTDPEDLLTLDPLFHWTMHCGREALREAGLAAPQPRTGLVLGVLGYPSHGMTRFTEQTWARSSAGLLRRTMTGTSAQDPRNAFPCGLAAHLTARALGLGGGSVALDAACASSLYALKLAADRLHDGTADVMLAGAVNRVDDLYLHAGFGALGAISRTGRSRPFARTADGLVPAEGAACVALMRLADAIQAGTRVLAVIRGIGLTNGGRGAGLLAPYEPAQERAIAGAYRSAELDPASVSLLECHATGTSLGDAAEVRSAAKVFDGIGDLPVGSVKSNIGHPGPVAGLAALLKLIGAMHAGVRPATLGAEDPVEVLSGTRLRPLGEHEPWPGRRRAGLSTFGFGGNNAHLVLDAGAPDTAGCPVVPRIRDGADQDEVAIVAIGARVGTGTCLRDFADGLFGEAAPATSRESVETPVRGLRFPPADLKQALAQQLLVLDAAREALAGQELPGERTMVLIGMGCDAEVVRGTARLRVPSWLAEAGAGEEVVPDPAARDAFGPPLTSAAVVGAMPNIVTNRLNSQFDLTGPSFSVFAEEASGPAALAIGCRALRAGEADAVLVGAVDLADEPVQQAALRALGLGRRPGDAAVALLLRRRADAEREGAEIIALIDQADLLGTGPGITVGPDGFDAVPHFDPAGRFGSAHAAAGLVAVAAAALAIRHRAEPRTAGPARALLGTPVAEVVTTPLGAHRASTWVRAAAPAPWPAEGYAVHVFGGRDRREVAGALRDGHRGGDGPCRLAFVERPGDVLADRREAALRWLAGQGERPPATTVRDRPAGGEIAFVYPNGSACYPEMGHPLMLAFPELMDGIREVCGDLTRIGQPVLAGRPADPVQKNLASSLLADLHTRLTRDVLGIRPHAMLGYSSGEGSGVTALRTWPDLPALLAEVADAECYRHGLVGEQRIARRAWRALGVPDDRWVNLLVAAPAEEIEAVLHPEPAVFLLAVNAPRLCVIGGAARACDRVAARLGGASTVLPLDYDIAAHARVLDAARPELHRLYHRPVRAEPGLRFYTGATGTAYVPTAEAVAEAMIAVTLDRIDFAATVRNAWEDGVRVFIEHGPRNLCSNWISATLRDREHVAVALDGNGAGEDSLAALAGAIAELLAAGVPLDSAPVLERLAAAPPSRGDTSPVIVTPAHPSPVSTALSQPPFTAPPPAGRPTAPETAVHPLELDRTQLERLAAGEVAAVLGDGFAVAGNRARPPLPTPPLLLVDRVVSIDGEPGTMDTATIRTETEVHRDAWYLDGCGRFPPGLFIEGVQAYLLLLIWLGTELHVEAGRKCRVLGCDLTFHASPPATGTTAHYETTVDSHAEHEGIHLFFFHSRCVVDGETRLTVENGQTGYFTDEELAASSGVEWDAGDAEPPEGRWSPPALPTKASFDFAEVRALAEGRPDRCFGKGWETTRAHVRTPRIGNGRLQLLHRVAAFDPSGGPWQRGYLRAEFTISAQEWFFASHFAGDPCMPGTLMVEGCLQAMAFYLAGYGFTLDRDGWRFEPVPGETTRMRCRGQVLPGSRLLTYELFVAEIVDGPEPAVIADALCTVDGVKAMHINHLSLRLTPDWPLAHWSQLATPAVQPTGEPVPLERLGGLLGERTSSTQDGSRCAVGYPELMAAAWGPPARQDGSPVIRLPGPPYLFVSRVREFSAELEATGSSVVAEYEVPERAWFCQQSGSRSAPLAVLVEIASQPCSWLVGQLRLSRRGRTGARLRSLGGTLTVHSELRPSSGLVQTMARLVDVRETADQAVCTFEVRCRVGPDPLLTMKTRIGLRYTDSAPWPPELPGLGLPEVPGQVVLDLKTRPTQLFGHRTPWPGPMLSMVDRVTACLPDGGRAGLGSMWAERDVDPGDWYFRAHTFGDPLMPGSLALEAMAQLSRLCLLEREPAGVRGLRFEAPALGRELTWTHHGEVPPTCDRIALGLEITEVTAGAANRHAVADARMYAGGACVCHVRGMGMRMWLPRVPGKSGLDGKGYPR